jgi:hypothetical protein
MVIHIIGWEEIKRSYLSGALRYSKEVFRVLVKINIDSVKNIKSFDQSGFDYYK